MAEQTSSVNDNQLAEMPWSTFLLNLLLGRQRATPPEQVPLPPGRLNEMATLGTQGGAADKPERIMNQQASATDPQGLVGRMLSPEERQLLGILFAQLIK